MTEEYCNQCGGTLTVPHDDSPYGLVGAKVRGHYHSVHLSDGSDYTFSLCELCLRQMFDEFAIKPRVESVFDEDTLVETPYADDKSWYLHTLWRDAKGLEKKLAEDLCNATEDCPNESKYRGFSSGFLTNECVCEEHNNRLGTWLSSDVWVDKELLRSVQVVPEHRSPEEKKLIAGVWLRTFGEAKSWTYPAECIRDYLDAVESEIPVRRLKYPDIISWDPDTQQLGIHFILADPLILKM